jgi:hypothetical protein
VLLNHGYVVQGSDLKPSKITDRLRELGARIFIGQRAENLEEAEVVVISSAIKPGNPELDAARCGPAGGAPGRDAGRVDAAEIQRRGGRHPRQDDHHHDGRHAAGCGRDSTRR